MHNQEQIQKHKELAKRIKDWKEQKSSGSVTVIYEFKEGSVMATTIITKESVKNELEISQFLE